MKISLKLPLFAGIAAFCLNASAQTFDLIPLYGIRVNAAGLTYTNISVDAGAAAVVKNEIPHNQQFSVVVDQPEGFQDSAGWVLYGLEYTLLREDGSIVTHLDDIFESKGIATDTALQSIRLTNTFDQLTTAGSKLTLLGKLFDRNGAGYITFAYDVTVVNSTKKLPTQVFTYTDKDSRGMRSTSVGLHFNFFEFKGLTGNNFLFRVKKGDPIHFLLRGLEGWKIKEEKAAPIADLIILDVNGKEVEQGINILSKSIGSSIAKDKKEIEVKYNPENTLQTGQFYFAWFKLRDANSSKNAMDVVIKFYVED
jgi:hypothetical protein